MKGAPDWGLTAAKTTLAPVTDLGELAARLGSIVTFDRRGDVVWIDDFEDGALKWALTTVGAGSVLEANADRARSGGNCVHAKPDNNSGDYCNMAMFAPYSSLSKYGFEISFTLNDGPIGYIVRLHIYDGTNRQESAIKLDRANKEILYLDSTNDWIKIADITNPNPNTRLFSTVKLVTDFENEKYVRAIFNSVEYDLSTHSTYKVADVTGYHMQIEFKVLEKAGVGDDDVYIDDAIITQNEP